MNKPKYIITVVVYLIFLVVSELSISLSLPPNESSGDANPVRHYVASSVNPMVSNSTKKAM